MSLRSFDNCSMRCSNSCTAQAGLPTGSRSHLLAQAGLLTDSCLTFPLQSCTFAVNLFLHGLPLPRGLPGLAGSQVGCSRITGMISCGR
jgi:hypothetical protein